MEEENYLLVGYRWRVSKFLSGHVLLVLLQVLLLFLSELCLAVEEESLVFELFLFLC